MKFLKFLFLFITATTIEFTYSMERSRSEQARLAEEQARKEAVRRSKIEAERARKEKETAKRYAEEQTWQEATRRLKEEAAKMRREKEITARYAAHQAWYAEEQARKEAVRKSKMEAEKARQKAVKKQAQKTETKKKEEQKQQKNKESQTNNHSTGLQNLEKKLRETQSCRLNKLKETFNIPNHEWEKTMFHLAKATDFIKNDSFIKPVSSVMHDTTLPSYILETTKRILSNNGINPACISLLNGISGNNHKHLYATTLAQAENPILTMTIYGSNTYNISFTTSKPATIRFNVPALQQLPKEEIEAVIAHEVAHLTENHATESAYLLRLLEKYGVNKNTIKNHPVWLSYSRSIETNADLLPAIKNKSIALGMKSFYQRQYNPHSQKTFNKNGTHSSIDRGLRNINTILKYHTA